MSLERSPSIGNMLRCGPWALRRYTGVATTLYLVQLAISTVAAFAMSRVLAAAFAQRPMFDRAVDGDLVSMIMALRGEPWVIPTLWWLGLGTVLLYAALSWLLTGGLISVLVDRPTGRTQTVRSFGAGAVGALFPYFRLFLLSLIPYAITATALVIGVMTVPDESLADALTLTDTLLIIVPHLLPAALLYWFVGTVLDYARIDLVRHEGLASWRALVRATVLVVRRPRTLVHVGLFYIFVALATAALSTATFGRPMGGASGAMSLVILRQVTTLIRFSARIALIAGQTEMSQLTVFPPSAKR